MKKFLVLLLSLFSIFTYAANCVNDVEVNKYIRQKLDRDKTITFTNKLNKLRRRNTCNIFKGSCKFAMRTYSYLVS